MKFTKNIGMLLLAIWLILTGLFTVVPSLNFSQEAMVMAMLGIVSGVFIAIGR
jgi:hypothetical protein